MVISPQSSFFHGAKVRGKKDFIIRKRAAFMSPPVINFKANIISNRKVVCV